MARLSSLLFLFLIRLLKYIGLLCLFYGLAQGNFPEMAEMSSLKVLGAMMASEMTASMPVPALMSFGTWELGGMTLLAFFGAIPQAALLTLLGVHIQTQALDYGIGIAAFLALFCSTVDASGRPFPAAAATPCSRRYSP